MIFAHITDGDVPALIPLLVVLVLIGVTIGAVLGSILVKTVRKRDSAGS